jgi:sugar/nucleoside kinase (ribokinase family)
MRWRLMICHSSVGAGDTFIAGMLFGLMEEARLEKSVDLLSTLKYANRLASLKAGREGFNNLGADLQMP